MTGDLKKDAKGLWAQGRPAGCVWGAGFCLWSVLFPWVVGFAFFFFLMYRLKFAILEKCFFPQSDLTYL